MSSRRRGSFHWLLLTCWLSAAACQPASNSTIQIVDEGTVSTVQTAERVPLLILTHAGISVGPDDRVLADGMPVRMDQPLPAGRTTTLQIRRAVELTLSEPAGEQILRSAAFTVGEALVDNRIELMRGEDYDPPLTSFIAGPGTVSKILVQGLSVTMDGGTFVIHTAAATVGEALAEGGLPLIGLDFSVPAPEQAIPADRQVRVVRVSESVILAMNPIPFTSEFQESAELEFGQEEVLQAGETGLAISRIRVRYEDGAEVARTIESEAVVRPPRPRLAARGTRIVLKTTTVDGATIEYWHAIQMYATSYSPCRSGVEGQCFSGTSLGLPVKKGVVAVDISFYNQMAGQQIYVAGYGPAVIADVGAGRMIEASLGIPRTRWIDLGYSDSDWQQWGAYVTVYFLAPAPAEIPYVLQ